MVNLFKMKTIELFSGTGSFSKVAKNRGHSIFRVEMDKQFEAELYDNILNVDYNILPDCDIIWASPPCQCFSVASIGKHWTGGNKSYTPKTESALDSLEYLGKLIYLIYYKKPKYWFIENPRGVMRKIIDRYFKFYELDFIRHTVTYCQYGDTRMKPTDIWTNCKEWLPRKPCKNGSPCHVSAPRGSKTGTQGLKSAKERSVVPEKLCLEILEVCEKNMTTK